MLLLKNESQQAYIKRVITDPLFIDNYPDKVDRITAASHLYASQTDLIPSERIQGLKDAIKSLMPDPLKGERGESIRGKDGVDGKDGSTPATGVDYFTEQDIKDFKASIIEGLDIPAPINKTIVKEVSKDITQEDVDIITDFILSQVTPLTGDQIVEVLEDRKGDKRLDASAIKNLPKPRAVATGGIGQGFTDARYLRLDTTNDPLVGDLNLGDGVTARSFTFNGAAGQIRAMRWATAGLLRWVMSGDGTAESGSNVGSDFKLQRYDDAGDVIGTVLFIKRSDGSIGVNTLTPDALLGLKAVSSSQVLYRLRNDQNSTVFFIQDRDADHIIGVNTTAPDAAFGIKNRNDSNPIWRLRNSSNTTQVIVNGSGNMGVGTSGPTAKLDVNGTTRIRGTLTTNSARIKSTETSTETATMSNTVEIHFCNSASAYTLTLPAHANGKEIKIINKAVGVVTLSPTSGNIIGDATQELFQYETAILISDGTDWF